MIKTLKINGLLMALFITLFSFAPGAFAYSGGSGTSADPYLISTQSDLDDLASAVNSGTDYSGVYFEQTDGITLTNETWTPIGYYDSGTTSNSKAFNGNYNGNGYMITGITITDGSVEADKSYGFFGYIGTSGNVHDLLIRGVNIEGGENGYRIGGIAGVNAGAISSILINNAMGIEGNSYLGGAVGVNMSTGTISNVYINARNTSGTYTYSVISTQYPTSAEDMFYVGGVAGYNEGNIYDCAVGTSFSATAPSGIGGIVGYNAGTIAGTYLEGMIYTSAWIEESTTVAPDTDSSENTEDPDGDEDSNLTEGSEGDEEEEPSEPEEETTIKTTLIGALAATNDGTILNSAYVSDRAQAVNGWTQVEITDDEGNGTGEYETVNAYVNAAVVGNGTTPDANEYAEVESSSDTLAVGFVYSQPREVTGQAGDEVEETSASTPFPYYGEESQFNGTTTNSSIATVSGSSDTTQDDGMGGTTTIPGYYAPKITFNGTGEATITWTFTTAKIVATSSDTTRSYSFAIDVTTDYTAVEEITWSDSSWGGTETTGLTMPVGETRTLVAEVSPSTATIQSILWTSSDDSIATVTGGVVEGVSNGTVTITATASGSSNNLSRTKEITVKTPLSTLTAVDPYKSVSSGSSVSFTVTGTPDTPSVTRVNWSYDLTGTGNSYQSFSVPYSTLSNGSATNSQTINFNDGVSDTVLVKAEWEGDTIDDEEYSVDAVYFTLTKRDDDSLPSPTGDYIIDETTGSGVIPVTSESGEELYIQDFLKGNYANGTAYYIPDGIDGDSATAVQPNGSDISVSYIPAETARTYVDTYWDIEDGADVKGSVLPNTETAVTTYSYTPSEAADANEYLPLELNVTVPASSIPSRLYGSTTTGDYITFGDTVSEVLNYVHLFAFVETDDGTQAVSISNVCGSATRDKYISVTYDEDSDSYIFNVRLLVFDQAGGRDDSNNSDGKNLWVSTIANNGGNEVGDSQFYIVLQDGSADGTYKVSLGAACITTNTGTINVTVTNVADPSSFSYTLYYGQALSESQTFTGTDEQQLTDIMPGSVQIDIPVISGTSGVVWEVVGDSQTALTSTTSGNTMSFTTTLDAGSTLNLEIEYGTTKITSMSFDPITLEINSSGSGTQQIELNVLPADAVDRTVSYESADTNIATVDANGLVTAVGTNNAASATTYITVTAVNNPGVTYTGTVTVIQKPYDMTIEGPDEIMINNSESYTVSFDPSFLDGEAVTWTVTTDGGYATVDSGTVTGTGAGMVTLTATYAADSDYSAEKSIHIIVPVETIEADNNNFTIRAGESSDVVITFDPTDVSDMGMTWTTSDASIATVVYDEETTTATITGVGAGEVTLTGTTIATDESGDAVFIEITVRVMSSDATDDDLAILEELETMGDEETLPSGVNTDSDGILSPNVSSGTTSNSESISSEMENAIKNSTAEELGLDSTDGVVIFTNTDDDGNTSNMIIVSADADDSDAYWRTTVEVTLSAEQVAAATSGMNVGLDDFVITLMFKDSEGMWNPITLNSITDAEGNEVEYYTIERTSDGGIKISFPAIIFDKEATISSDVSPEGYPYVMSFVIGDDSDSTEYYLIMDGIEDGEYMFGVVVSAADTSSTDTSGDGSGSGSDSSDDSSDSDDEDSSDTTDGDTTTEEPDDSGGSGGCNTGLTPELLLLAIGVGAVCKGFKARKK